MEGVVEYEDADEVKQMWIRGRHGSGRVLS